MKLYNNNSTSNNNNTLTNSSHSRTNNNGVNTKVRTLNGSRYTSQFSDNKEVKVSVCVVIKQLKFKFVNLVQFD